MSNGPNNSKEVALSKASTLPRYKMVNVYPSISWMSLSINDKHRLFTANHSFLMKKKTCLHSSLSSYSNHATRPLFSLEIKLGGAKKKVFFISFEKKVMVGDLGLYQCPGDSNFRGRFINKLQNRDLQQVRVIHEELYSK